MPTGPRGHGGPVAGRVAGAARIAYRSASPQGPCDEPTTALRVDRRGRFRRPRGPACAVRRMADRGRDQGAQRPQRHGAGHGRRRRLPNVRMVLLKGVERSAASCSTPISTAPRGASSRPSEGGAVFPLEVAAPAGAPARTGRNGERGRGRRLFRQPAARQPHRRLGLAAVAARWKAASRWRRRWPNTPRDMPSATVPRPPCWSGFRLQPLAIEFWHDRPFRLHERVAFARPDLAAPWQRTRLYP